MISRLIVPLVIEVIEKCTLCYDFGYRQIYQAGRVKRIFCECPAGQKRKEKLENLMKGLKKEAGK